MSAVTTEPRDASFLRDELASSTGRLYAVIDSAGDRPALEQVERLGSDAVSLYVGKSAQALREVAPYLVIVNDELLTWLEQERWADPWGVFLSSPVTRDQLRKHLRRFLMVEGPDGAEKYFRFYDPRVLQVFLQSLTAEEAEDFFGPVSGFCVASGKATISQMTRMEVK